MALIDLRSDTLSMPIPEMLQSVLSAPLGDDSRDGRGPLKKARRWRRERQKP